MGKTMSLKARVIALLVGVVGIGFAVSFGVLMYQATQLQKKTAVDHATELARYEAQRVATKLEKALQLSRSYALALNQLRVEGQPDRAHAVQLLSGMLQGHPEYVGVASGWEKNDFDGKDSDFVSAPYHDASGRFMPYLFRDDKGKVAVDVLVDYEKPGDGDYYLIPRATGKPAIIEPYVYPVAGVDTLMTTLVTPVMEGGQFKGIVTVDMSLSELQQHVRGIRAYDNGYASLVSHQGVYVGNKDAQTIGKPMPGGDGASPLMKAVHAGQSWIEETADAQTGEDSLRIFVPVTVDGLSTPWALGLTIPMSNILSQVITMRWVALALGLVSALLVMLTVVVILNRLILRPLGGEPAEAAKLAAQVAKGDFSHPVSVGRAAPHSVMAQLAEMQRNLSNVVRNVRNSASSVALASGEISQGNLDLSQRTESQASALEQTSASMEQLNATVQQNVGRSRSASALATEAAQVAEQGGQAMQQMLASMQAISQSSSQIGDIIGVIDSIAFQTNILALNAAVEAARAGEQGRGFAVVASEVRSLAGRSADAAKQIKQLIENSVHQVQAGSQQAEQVGLTIAQVVQVIGKLEKLMAEVSSASSEQGDGVAQVGEAVTQMDTTTQKNAALVEQMAAAASSLNTRAEELVDLVSVFKLEGEAASSQPAARRQPELLALE